LAEESQNPIKDLPLSINYSIGICSLLYCMIAVSLSGMAKLQNFKPETAMAEAFSFKGMEWMSIVIYISAFVGITG
jgi:APA family basic amino acid/polyamine antiporter